MSIFAYQRVIAIEEYYYDLNVISHYSGVDVSTGRFVKDRLLEVGEKRLEFMEYAG